MTKVNRRTFVQGGVGLTVANMLPGTMPFASAATMEESTIEAAKKVGAAQVNGMIWSPYYVPMQPVIAEFTKATGIGIGGVQDISIFDAPQRAMAEALSRSPQFDFIHIDSNMIPSLASAGYLEPLDEYIKNSDFKFDVVAGYDNFMKYDGHTYGVPTDGNVHIQYTRKDLIDDPDNKKRFADKFGTELKIAGNLGREPAAAGVLDGSVEGPLWLGQPAQPRQRPDLVVHGLLQRRRLPLRRRHEADARYSGRPIRGRHLSAGQEGQPSGSGQLGHAADDPAHRARARGELPVLGRHLQDDQKSEAVKDGRPVLLQRGARLEVQRQDAAPLDLVPARRDPHQQVQPAQGAGRLSRALARLRQEQHSDRVRSGERVQRCLVQRALRGAAGDRRLYARRHQRHQEELRGGLPAGLFDRLPRIPGRARKEPVGSLYRPDSRRRTC